MTTECENQIKHHVETAFKNHLKRSRSLEFEWKGLKIVPKQVQILRNVDRSSNGDVELLYDYKVRSRTLVPIVSQPLLNIEERIARYKLLEDLEMNIQELNARIDMVASNGNASRQSLQEGIQRNEAAVAVLKRKWDANPVIDTNGGNRGGVMDVFAAHLRCVQDTQEKPMADDHFYRFEILGPNGHGNRSELQIGRLRTYEGGFNTTKQAVKSE